MRQYAKLLFFATLSKKVKTLQIAVRITVVSYHFFRFTWMY